MNRKEITLDDIARKLECLNLAIMNFREDQENYQNILEDKIDHIADYEISSDFRDLKKSFLATKSGCGQF